MKKNSCRACRPFLLFFGDKNKIAFKSSLDLYFQPLIIEFFWFATLQFRIEEKIHTQAVANVSRGAGGRVFPCGDGKGVSRKL